MADGTAPRGKRLGMMAAMVGISKARAAPTTATTMKMAVLSSQPIAEPAASVAAAAASVIWQAMRMKR